MGVSKKDFAEFSKEIDFGDYFETHDRTNVRRIIRDFHNEFSGRFIVKYADLFDIPSKEHLRAIIQIARGHRKTDLTDPDAYPIALEVPGGNTVCLPYLTSILRLSDEIDITAARNSHLLSEIPTMVSDMQKMEYLKHDAVREMKVERDRFTVIYSTDSPEVEAALFALFTKMQKTLDECRAATNGRTGHVISQKEITGKIV
ncbi:MAG: hypothetical protein II776_05370 [Clostridia bacterium]|nr:hypothetical protein [Clostridia bacterium]